MAGSLGRVKRLTLDSTGAANETRRIVSHGTRRLKLFVPSSSGPNGAVARGEADSIALPTTVGLAAASNCPLHVQLYGAYQRTACTVLFEMQRDHVRR